MGRAAGSEDWQLLACDSGAIMILAVDRNHRNLELLANLLRNEGFEIISGVDLEGFDRALARPEAIRLALVDLDGFDAKIWERCLLLQQARIPFLVVLPFSSSWMQLEKKSHECGALAVLLKPVLAKRLLGLIHTLLQRTPSRI